MGRAIRQCILWLRSINVLDVGDPLYTVQSYHAADPDNDMRGQVFKAWFGVFEDQFVTVKELITHLKTTPNSYPSLPALHDVVHALPALQDAVHDIAGTGQKEELSSRKIGNWLTKNLDGIAGDLKLVRAATKKSGNLWSYQIMKVSGPVVD